MRGADLSLAERAIAFTLATYANVDGTRAFPGIERLIADTGASDKTIRRALKALEAKGWVECMYRGRRNSGASEYRLTIPRDRLHLAPQPKAPNVKPLNGRRKPSWGYGPRTFQDPKTGAWIER